MQAGIRQHKSLCAKQWLYFAVGEAMEEPARLNLFQLFHDISIAAARRGRNNVLVKGPWDEHDQDKQVDHGTHGAHGFWSKSCEHGWRCQLGMESNKHLRLLELAQIPPLE